MSLNIKNLVFQGGGVKGIAYAGALKALNDAKLLEKVTGFAGTSAGAITATLLALGYSAKEVSKIIFTTDFKKFEDGWNPIRLLTKYGLYKGNYFHKLMAGYVAKKLGSEKATFAYLKAETKFDLRIFATDLNTNTAKEFSPEKTPTVAIADAVRASMSIPLFFRAWQFPNNDPNDHVYVDGGTVFNYPITAFDRDYKEEETLGFHLDNLSSKPKPNDLKFCQIKNYIRDLFEAVMQAQVIDFNRNPEEEKRTVRLDDHGISATDFNLTAAQKDELYKSGLELTNKFLKRHGV